MNRSGLKPSVLAVTKDSFILRQTRLAMPLLNLKNQGLISDYFITNPTLFDVPDDALFDVVWLQRVDDRRLLAHLARKIDNLFLYDLDDLLIGQAAYRGDDLVSLEAVAEAVRRCRVLTVTSTRLVSLLEKYVGSPLIHKSVTCPNAFGFPVHTRVPVRPKGLIFSSTEYLPLTESQDQVLAAVRDFSDKYELPIYYFGRHPETVSAWWRKVICVGLVPYWQYHAFLAALPAMIGIAPLETVADQKTLDFINCKSDVKMLEYGGHGHPGVYSNAPPYVDTDLRAGVVVENTGQAWSAGLEATYHELWKELASDQRRVVELRHMDRVVAECWYPAIVRATLPHPLSGKDLKFSKGKLGGVIQAARHLTYCQDYLFMKRLQKQIPPFLLRMVKRLY